MDRQVVYANSGKLPPYLRDSLPHPLWSGRIGAPERLPACQEGMSRPAPWGWG